MPPSETRFLHATMIPWVLALVALVGLSALLPGQRISKRQETSHDSGISSLSDDVQMRGRSLDPVVFLEPAMGGEIKAGTSFIWIPRIASRHSQPATDCFVGAAHGRAPPVRDIA